MSKWNLFLLVLCLGVFSSLAQAQKRFEEWVRPAENSIQRSETFERALPDYLTYLENEERELIALKDRIEGYGHSAIDFLQLMSEMSQDPQQTTKVQEVLREVRPLVVDLNSRLDNYIQDTLDLSMAIVLHALNRDLSLAPQLTSDIWALQKEVIKQRDIYLEHKKEYGEGKDTKRTTAYNRFFAAAKTLYAALDQPQFSRTRRLGHKVANILGQALWVLQRPSLSANFLKTLLVVLRSPQPEDGKNPVIASVMQLSRQIGDELGIKVHIEGKENLVSSGPNEITILVPSHRQMMRDQIGIANLHFEDDTPFDIDTVAPFAAAHVYRAYCSPVKSKSWDRRRRSKANPKPIEKAAQILEQSDLRMFMNYAGGRLPEGLGATMGVRKKFFEMVRSLEAKGFKVNILALSMRDNAKLFGTRSLTRNEDITLKVPPILKHDTRHLIMELGGEDSVALMMRFGLIQDLVTNEELIFGQVRGSKLNEALSEYLFDDANCQRLLSK